MASFKCIVDKVSLRFLRGGTIEFTDWDPATQLVADMGESSPDFITERYDVTAPTLRRAATPAEIAADLVIRTDAQVDGEINTKALKALGFTLLQRILGRNPTLAERQQLISDVKTVYKAL